MIKSVFYTSGAANRPSRCVYVIT